MELGNYVVLFLMFFFPPLMSTGTLTALAVLFVIPGAESVEGAQEPALKMLKELPKNPY